MAEPTSNETPPYKDDPSDEDEYSRSHSTSSDRPSSTARHIELTQRTNELLSNFGNFLSELAGDTISPTNGGGEFGTSTGLQQPRGSLYSSTDPNENLSPFRSYSDHGDASYQPADGNLWNREHYDYDADRKKLYRYRLFGGSNIAYVCTFGVIIALIVIAGVSIGGARKDGGPSTAFVEGEDEVTAEKVLPADGSTTVDEAAMNYDPQTEADYLAIASTFKPKWFNRQSGWEGQAYLQAYEFCNSQNNMQPCPYTAICPGGVGNDPYGGVRDRPVNDDNRGGMNVAWAPIKNVPNEWVQVSLGPEGGGGNIDPNANKEEVWNDGTGGEICQLFSVTHNGSVPRWGLTGEYDESLTQNILCCLVDADIRNEEPEAFSNVVNQVMGDEEDEGSDFVDRPPSLEEDEESKVGGEMGAEGAVEGSEGLADVASTGDEEMENKEEDSEPSSSNADSSTEVREPEIPAYWYSRSDGWLSTTYQGAKEFCISQNNKSICPFQLYCPDGPGGVPFAASAQQALLEYDSLFWSPVMNGLGEEAWAGIGSANRCVPPLDKPRVSPEMLYNATSFIMCCEMGGGGKEESAPSSSEAVAEEEISDNSKTTTSSSAASESSNQETQAETEEISEDAFIQAAKEVWDPQWFSSSDGWNGGSYSSAIDFCKNNIPNGELCPYQAICPNGMSTDPYMSSKVIPLENDQWVPTRSNIFSYILVSHSTAGEEKGEICNGYEYIEGEKPRLGTTEEMTELKQYLLCCHHYDGDE